MTLGRRSTKDTRSNGFTLIELLVVIVVIGVLAGIVTFALGSFRSDARNASCRTDVRTLQTASAAYLVQHGSNAHDLDALLSGGYIKSLPQSGVTFADGATNPASVAECTGELAFTPDPTTTTTTTSSTPTLSVSTSGWTVHPGAPGTPDFTANVTVTVTDQNHVVVQGAVVAGAWNDAANTPASCAQPTDASGTCSFASGLSTPLPNQLVTWSLSSVTKTGYVRAPGSVTLACSRHNNAGGTQLCV